MDSRIKSLLTKIDFPSSLFDAFSNASIEKIVVLRIKIFGIFLFLMIRVLDLRYLILL